jgi:hypothetical protein
LGRSDRACAIGAVAACPPQCPRTAKERNPPFLATGLAQSARNRF